ncbi:diguanylate cyclase [Desulfobulbus alkaliphilus]|uniref:diguanylate cyclase n=1 Tax=Desulfobulbus alkaliphilus TaxID=869814 RepID=UPI001964EF9A|nr:diguanylate cyclase [Desulfobulbus alkaliphilus]MBM9536089.1 diguanylate cyclase [Desulfobulbus alkaliphilus]
MELTAQQRAYLDRLGKVTMCVDPDWQPYEHMDEQGNFTGIASDLVEIISQRLGIPFVIVPTVDWQETLVVSREGGCMLIPFLNQTTEREEWLDFTEPLFVAPNVFITRNEHDFISNPSELVDRTVVLPHGTSMEEFLRRDYPNLDIITVDSEHACYRMVSEGKADMTLRSLTIAAYTIRKDGWFNLKIAGQPPEPHYVNHLRMGVLKETHELTDILNKAILTITPREREEIINRHVNIEFVQAVDLAWFIRLIVFIGVLLTVSFYWNHRLKNALAALRETERSKSVLIANIPGMAYRCLYDRDWTMQFVSRGCRELTGYESEELVDNRVVSYNSLIVPEYRESIVEQWEKARSSKLPVELEYRIITADKTVKWVYEKGVLIYDDHDNVLGIEGLIIDISDRKAAEEKLSYLAATDELTGLWNRRHFMQALQQEILRARRYGQPFSLLMLDIDHFKAINDRFGHDVGDATLRHFSMVITGNIRKVDIFARTGGEEFMLLLPRTDLDGAYFIAERLRKYLETSPIPADLDPFHISVSIGVTVYTPEIAEPDQMLKIVDDALYEAKKTGRNRSVKKTLTSI